MQWLIANMWIALAVAGLLGLVFGFSIRGLMGRGKVRRAQVERDVARTELEQSRAEVDALYAAQRKRQEIGDSGGVSEELQAELAEREGRLAKLTGELGAARRELEDLKAQAGAQSGNMLQTAGAALAGAVGGAVVASRDDGKLSELQDRNSWLEERVAALEAELSSKADAVETATSHAVVDEEKLSASADAAAEKLTWQNAYLRQRVEALEASLVAVPDVAPVLSTEPVSDTGSEEEMARLRWRNRYLEGRLAYFEEATDAEVSDNEADATVALTAVGAVAASLAGTEGTDKPTDEDDAAIGTDTSLSDPLDGNADNEIEEDSDVSDDPEDFEEFGDEVSAQDTDEAFEDGSEDLVSVTNNDDEEDSEDIHPSEAMLAELDEEVADDEGEEDFQVEDDIRGEQPTSIDMPESGGDDLTAITGIGPRIEEILNELGIWTYDQIAQWTPENEAWVEEHLSFKGRISREEWVQQARQLMEQRGE